MHPVFRRIFCFCTVIAIIGTLFAVQEEKPEGEAPVFSADLHQKQGINCVACHGEGEPAAPVPGKVCLVCHESLEAVAEKTAAYMPNPHSNHITETTVVECTECHNGHKANNPTCDQCHPGMPFNKQQ